jgi:ribosome-associated protein
MYEVRIRGEFITLGQLLKLAGVVGSGGETKTFLMETSIRVNGEHDNRRGRKIRPGDIVQVETEDTIKVLGEDDPE